MVFSVRNFPSHHHSQSKKTLSKEFIANVTAMTQSSISRVTGISPRQFYAEYIEQQQPVILTDAARDWTALEFWSFAYLKSTLQHHPAIVGGPKLKWQGHSLTVGEYIDLATADSPPSDLPYLRAASIPVFYPELVADLQPLLRHSQPNRMSAALLPRQMFGHPDGKIGYPELFIGAPGRGTPLLHYDVGLEHAFITQIIGDKEFFVFAPDQAPYLYPNELQPNQSNLTELLEPDLARFPLFARAQMERVVVRAGETLFIPSGWWHMSYLLTPSVSISMNAVSAVNWKSFCNHRLRQIPNPSRRKFMRIYLAVLDQILSTAEKLGFGTGKRLWG